MDGNYEFTPGKHSIHGIYNTSDMGVIVKKYNREFDKMWADKGFLDGYTSQGWELDDLILARENTAALELDYQEASTDSEEQPE